MSAVQPQPEAAAEPPRVLILHDGELADLVGQLSELGARCTPCLGSPRGRDLELPFDLIAATPQRLIDLEGKARVRGVRIAIADDDTRTLRATLRRAHADFTVFRPVHPAALRLLLLHVLYRGPEKRRHRRVSVGLRAQLVTLWRRRAVVLADLSATGCRLIADFELASGARLQVAIPASSVGGRCLRLRGRVVRCAPEPEPPDSRAIAVVFDPTGRRQQERLDAVVRAHRMGPATFDGSLEDGPGEPAATPEQRSGPRPALDRPIVALGEESASVLLGRDISLGGMRVQPHPGLGVGDELQLAIHVRAREEPLLVRSRVTRDDGTRGLVLQFVELSASAQRYLERMVSFLPILAVRARDGETGFILSQILEHVPGPRAQPG